MNHAYELIEEGQLDDAIAVGRQLLDLRHTSGFEILALAHAGNGEMDEAIAVLERGVRNAPDVWLLWQLLGNNKSEQGEFAAAYKAYERALACPHADVDSITLNKAIAKERDGAHDEALALLDTIERFGGPCHARAVSVKMGILIDQKRYVEAVKDGRMSLSHVDDESDNEELGQLKAITARAIWLSEHNSAEALALAHDSLHLVRGCEDALWLIREVRGDRRPDTKYLRLLVAGSRCKPEEHTEYADFYTSYDAVAVSPEQALELIRELEREDIGNTLTIEECEVLEDRPNDPVGVYKMTMFHCYPNDASE